MIALFNTHFLAANLFNDGGTVNMSLILITMIIAIVFLIVGFINLKKDTSKVTKMLKLANDATLLSLALGFLFSVVGLIGAFDSIEAVGEAAPAVFAGGLKISLLTATFGLFQFVVVRLGILLLKGMQK
ncbi:MAG: MotA/TolQ/ExbB proton channel family protein [bacterium]